MTSITWLWIVVVVQGLTISLLTHAIRRMQRAIDETATREVALHYGKVKAREAVATFRKVLAHNLRTRICATSGILQGSDALYNQIAHMIEVDPFAPGARWGEMDDDDHCEEDA